MSGSTGAWVPPDRPEEAAWTPPDQPIEQAWTPPDAPVQAAPKLDFKSIYQDPETRQRALRYMKPRLGENITEEDAIREMISRNSWADANTAAAALDYGRTQFENDQDKEDHAFLRQRFNDLPYFWQKGGRGAAGLVDNIAKGAVDPVNYIGGPLLKGAAALAGKTLTTGARIAGTAGIDAAASAGANVLQQSTEKDLGLRDGVSLGEAAIAGGVGAAASGAGNLLGARFGSKVEPKPTGNEALDTVLANKNGTNPNAPEADPVLGQASRTYQAFADATEPLADLQRQNQNGANIKDLSKTTKAAGAGADDPADNSLVRFRGLAAMAERGRQFMDEATFLPAERGAKLGTAESGYSRKIGEGLNRIVQDIEKKYGVARDAVYEVDDALRARWIRDVVNPYKRSLGEPEIGLGKFQDAAPFLKPGVNAADATAKQVNSIDSIIAHAQQQPWFTEIPRIQKFYNDVLEYGVSSQAIDRAAADRMLGKHLPNPDNIPFHYAPWMPEFKGGGGGSKGGGANASSPLRQKLTGGMGNRADAQARREYYVMRSIAAADRNLANLAWVDDVMKAQGNGAYGGKTIMRIANDAGEAARIAREDAEKALARLGIPTNQLSELDIMQASILAERRGGASSGPTRKLTVFRDGKMELYEILDKSHVALYDSMQPEELPAVFKLARGISRGISDLVTNSPSYILWAMAKDTIGAGIHSPHKFVPVLDSAKGYSKLVQGQFDPAMKDKILEARRSGAGFAGRTTSHKLLQTGSYMDRMHPHEGVIHSIGDYLNDTIPGRAWAKWVELNNQIELAPRLIEFMKAKDAGMSGLGAGYAAREVTVDFSRRGASPAMREFAGMTSFLNASLQGVDRTFRALIKESGPAAWAAIATGLVAPPILLHAINANHETYQSASPQEKKQAAWVPIYRDWDEAARWHAGTQNKFDWGDGVEHTSPQATFIKVPLPEPIVLFASIVNGFLDALRTGNGDAAVAGAIEGFGAALPGMHVPDFASPVINHMANEDGLGREITPAYMESRDKIDQVRPGQTTTTAINIAEFVQKWTRNMSGEGREGAVPLSPIEIDFFIQSYFPGMAALLFRTVDSALGRDERLGERPTPRLDQIDPVNPLSAGYRRFFAQGNNPSNESQRELYDLSKRADAAAKGEAEPKTMRDVLTFSTKPGRAEETETLAQVAPALKEAKTALSEVNAAIEAVEVGDLPAAMKRAEMNKLIAQRDQIVAQTKEMLRTEFPVLFRTWLNPNPEKNTPNASLVHKSKPDGSP